LGRPTCLSFSKNNLYLLIGNSEGCVQVWDGQNLGTRNIKLLYQKVAKVPILSLCWFHYSGESQSLRFLAISQDGAVKLYSFWFERKDEVYIGKCTELSLLYINRQ
jgi:WD40 repeat protein